MANANSHQELLVHLRELCFQATCELLIDSGAPFYEQTSENIVRLENLARQLEKNQGGLKQKFLRLMFEQESDASLDEALRLGNTLSCCLNCCVPHMYAICEGLSCVKCVHGTYAVEVRNEGERVIRVHSADPDCIDTGRYKELRIKIDTSGDGKILGATYKTLSNLEQDVPKEALDALLRQYSF